MVGGREGRGWMVRVVRGKHDIQVSALNKYTNKYSLYNGIDQNERRLRKRKKYYS